MSQSPNILLRLHYYEKDSPKRSFYSSQKTNGDYLCYMDNGHRSGKYQDYMDYQGNREKSSGVFDEYGLMDEKRKSKFRKSIQSTDSIIWDIIVSTEENFGKEKLRTWQSAKDVIKAELPKFLKDNNMPYSNIAWCGALHENTDNRHIHLLMHEKEMVCFDPDTKKKRFHQGILSKLSMEDFKVRIEQRLLGHEHSLHQYRDELLRLEEEKLKNVDSKAVYSKDLKAMLLELYRKAPKGEYGYESKKADEIRPMVDQITTYMLTNDDSSMAIFMDLLRKLKKRDEETKEICLRNKIDPTPHLIASSFKKDLYRRCGNKILKHIRTSQSLENKFMKGDVNQKKRWNEKARRKYLFSKALKLDSEISTERMAVFDEFQRLLKKAEYDRLVEEGVIEAE
jgi:hypothetical protein